MRRGKGSCRLVTSGTSSLAVGDVTGDGYPDVIQGVSFALFEDQQEPRPAGEVRVWRGGPRGPSRRPMVITQNSRGIPGHNQRGDQFGAAVAVARLDRDRYADILVGAPGEDHAAGRITIIRGGASGHAPTGNRTLERGGRGLPGRAFAGQQVGAALALLDVNGDHPVDLVIGAPALSSPTAPNPQPRGSLMVARARTHPCHGLRGMFTAGRTQSVVLKRLALPVPSDNLGTLGTTLGHIGSSCCMSPFFF